MKPLTEIKKMLEEISPWPWSYCGTIPANGAFHLCNQSDTTSHEILASGLGVFNASFIASAPEIISELVSEVKSLEKIAEIYRDLVISNQKTCLDLIGKNKTIESENSQLKLDLLTAQAQADGEYDESLKKEELALALKDNACVSAIAQVGGDPAIVGEMFEDLKFWIKTTDCYCASDKSYRCHVCATKALIAKAERKV